MNRKSPATALLAVVVVAAIVCLTPTSLGALKKFAPHPTNVTQPPAVAVDDSDTPAGPAGGTLIPGPSPIPQPDPRALALHDDMRHLWMDHIVWSRVITMGVFSDLKGTDAYKARLELNTYDLRALLVPYFGKEAAGTFADLFMRHVTLASDVLDAYKSGNETLIRDVTYDWYLNADELSIFLCKVNPGWDFAEMRSLWRKHLDTVVDEALDYQKGDYSGDVMCYDAAQDHVFVLADFLSDGILTRSVDSK